jgi:hypothetical protein
MPLRPGAGRQQDHRRPTCSDLQRWNPWWFGLYVERNEDMMLFSGGFFDANLVQEHCEHRPSSAGSWLYTWDGTIKIKLYPIFKTQMRQLADLWWCDARSDTLRMNGVGTSRSLSLSYLVMAAYWENTSRWYAGIIPAISHHLMRQVQKAGQRGEEGDEEWRIGEITPNVGEIQRYKMQLFADCQLGVCLLRRNRGWRGETGRKVGGSFGSTLSSPPRHYEKASGEQGQCLWFTQFSSRGSGWCGGLRWTWYEAETHRIKRKLHGTRDRGQTQINYNVTVVPLELIQYGKNIWTSRRGCGTVSLLYLQRLVGRGFRWMCEISQTTWVCKYLYGGHRNVHLHRLCWQSRIYAPRECARGQVRL